MYVIYLFPKFLTNSASLRLCEIPCQLKARGGTVTQRNFNNSSTQITKIKDDLIGYMP